MAESIFAYDFLEGGLSFPLVENHRLATAYKHDRQDKTASVDILIALG
jgi:hypothetical protein